MKLGNNFILIFNAVLFSGTFIFYQFKRKHFGIGSVVLLLYSIIAIIAIDLFNHPLSNFPDLTLFPFVYLYAMLMIVVYPILRIREYKIDKFQEPSKLYINSFSFIVIAVAVISFITLMKNSNRSALFDVFSYVRNSYQGDNIAHSKGENFSIIGVLSALFKDLPPMLFFYYLSRKNKNLFFCWGLAFAIVVGLIGSFTQAARGNLVKDIMSIIFSYLFFYHSMTVSIKKVSRYIAISFGLIISIPFVVITIGRFGENQENNQYLYYSLENYAGQSFPNFNNSCLDAGDIRYGDRTFPLFKQLLGLRTANNYTDRVAKYTRMKINESSFYTYVGDFTLDFGIYVTTLLFILFSFFSRTSLRIKYKFTFHQYLLYYFVFCISIGVFLFPFADIGGNLKIVLYIILYIIFKRDYIDQNKRIALKIENARILSAKDALINL